MQSFAHVHNNAIIEANSCEEEKGLISRYEGATKL